MMYMNEIKDLLINNWQLIVAAIMFILSFILQLIKKKPVTDIFSEIYKLCILAINDVENVEGSPMPSGMKLGCATSRVINSLKVKYPNVNFDKFIDYIHCVIEDILSTPQKKGGKTDGK